MNSVSLNTRNINTAPSVNQVNGPATNLAPPSIAPQSEFNADVATALATLILKTEFQNKALAHEQKKDAEAGVKAAQDAQLKDLREEADKKLDAATVTSIGEIGSGLMSMGTAGMDIATSNGKDVNGRELPREKLRIGNAAVDPRAENVLCDRDVGKGAGGVFEGSAKLTGAFLDHDASKANIRAKADENLSNEWKNSLDDAKDAKHAAEDRIGHVMEWLKSMHETTAQTTMSSIKG